MPIKRCGALQLGSAPRGFSRAPTFFMWWRTPGWGSRSQFHSLMIRSDYITYSCRLCSTYVKVTALIHSCVYGKCAFRKVNVGSKWVDGRGSELSREMGRKWREWVVLRVVFTQTLVALEGILGILVGCRSRSGVLGTLVMEYRHLYEFYCCVP